MGKANIAWAGAAAPHNLYASRYNGTGSLVNDTKNPVGTADDVSVVVANGAEWIGYHGTNGDVYYNRSADGVAFPTANQVQPAGATTAEGVGIECDKKIGDLDIGWQSGGGAAFGDLINLQYISGC